MHLDALEYFAPFTLKAYAEGRAWDCRSLLTSCQVSTCMSLGHKAAKNAESGIECSWY